LGWTGNHLLTSPTVITTIGLTDLPLVCDIHSIRTGLYYLLQITERNDCVV